MIRHSRRLKTSQGLAAGRVALALFAVTCGVNLQAPLYAAYAERAGMGAAATALAFCCYAASLLPCLLLLGGLSDRLGRRVMLETSLGCAILAALLMALHGSFQALILARLLQGLSVGFSFAAGAAWMRELIPADRAAHFTTASTALGFGIGPAATFLVLELWPEAGAAGATPGSYWIHPLLTLVAAALLFGIPQPGASAADRPAGYRPPLATLPLLPRGTWPAGLAIAIAWATAGLMIAVMPRALRVYGLDNWSGLGIFCVTAAGFFIQPLAQKLGAERSVRIGILVLPAAFLLIALGARFGWLAPLLLGAALNGSSSFGLAYLGGLRLFQAAAQGSSPGGGSQARAAAGYFLWIYLGFSLPVLGGGALADGIGMDAMLVVFGLAEVALCGWALAGLARLQAAPAR